MRFPRFIYEAHGRDQLGECPRARKGLRRKLWIRKLENSNRTNCENLHKARNVFSRYFGVLGRPTERHSTNPNTCNKQHIGCIPKFGLQELRVGVFLPHFFFGPNIEIHKFQPEVFPPDSIWSTSGECADERGRPLGGRRSSRTGGQRRI